MGSFQRFVSLETLYLGRGKCDCRPQMWQSIEDESAYMAQCSQVGNIGLVKVARRVGVWNGVEESIFFGQRVCIRVSGSLEA